MRFSDRFACFEICFATKRAKRMATAGNTEPNTMKTNTKAISIGSDNSMSSAKFVPVSHAGCLSQQTIDCLIRYTPICVIEVTLKYAIKKTIGAIRGREARSCSNNHSAHLGYAFSFSITLSQYALENAVFSVII